MFAFSPKLFHKVCLPIVGLTLALLFSIILALRSTQTQESQNALATGRDIVESSLSNLVENLSTVPHDLNRLNAITIERRWQANADLDWLRAAFYDQMRSFPEVDALYFGGEDKEFIGYARFKNKLELMVAGKATNGAIEFYSVDNRGLPQEKVRARANFPIQERPWYLAAKDSKDHTWGGIFTYHAAPIMAAPTSKPIYQNGKLIGVVGNNIFLNSLSQRLADLKHSEPDRFILLDDTHHIVADSTLEQPFTIDDKNTLRIHISDLPDDFSQQISAHFETTNDSTELIELSTKLGNTSQLAFWFPLDIPYGPRWQAIALLNDVHYEKLLRKQLQRLILVSIGGLLFLVVTLYVLLKLIVRPLNMMNHSANLMIGGNLNQSIDYQSEDELGILAKTFNKLAKELHSSISQLRQEKEAVENRDQQLNQSNAKLSRQRDYLANMQDLVGDGFFEWRPSENVLNISPNFSDSLGLHTEQGDREGSTGEPQQSSWQSIIHKDHISAFIAKLTHHFEDTGQGQSNRPFTTEVLAQGNTKPIWLLLKANRIKDLLSEENLIVGSVQNIDENHRQREQIQRLNERTALAVEASQCGIWDWDVVNDKLVWDNKMYALYNIKENDFLSAYEAWYTSLHPDDKVRAGQEVQDALAHRGDFDTQFRIIWPSGEVRHIRALAKVISDPFGKALRMVGVNFDNTKVIQYQERLKQANDESLQFAYRISHDIRGPLVSTLGLLDIAQEDLDIKDYAEVQSNLLRMKNRVEGLTTLVSDILALCKADLADQPSEPVNIQALVADIFLELKPLAQARQVTLSDKSEQLCTQVPLQQTRLRQVLRNLIENGIKYASPERAQQQKAFVSVKASANADKLDMEISDNGLGIAEEFHSQIYDLFCRFHPQAAEGSGLGMSIVQKHIQSMSGSLTFTSTVNEGTTFYLSLPIGRVSADISS